MNSGEYRMGVGERVPFVAFDLGVGDGVNPNNSPCQP